MTTYFANPYVENQRARCRAIAPIGDVDPITYGGGFVFECRSAGQPQPYDYRIEYTFGEEVDGQTLTLYRAEVPDDDVFAYYNWANIFDVARTSGIIPVSDLRRWSASTQGLDRALAVVAIAQHYGWHEFDQYPLQVSPAELRKRWRTALRRR